MHNTQSLIAKAVEEMIEEEANVINKIVGRKGK